MDDTRQDPPEQPPENISQRMNAPEQIHGPNAEQRRKGAVRVAKKIADRMQKSVADPGARKKMFTDPQSDASVGQQWAVNSLTWLRVNAQAGRWRKESRGSFLFCEHSGRRIIWYDTYLAKGTWVAPHFRLYRKEQIVGKAGKYEKAEKKHIPTPQHKPFHDDMCGIWVRHFERQGFDGEGGVEPLYRKYVDIPWPDSERCLLRADGLVTYVLDDGQVVREFLEAENSSWLDDDDNVDEDGRSKLDRLGLLVGPHVAVSRLNLTPTPSAREALYGMYYSWRAASDAGDVAVTVAWERALMDLLRKRNFITRFGGEE